MMSENEGEKYFAQLKRVLSGSIGKNLIDINFSTAQVADSEEHKLLMQLRQSSCNDEALREAFWNKVISTVSLDSAYLVLLGCDRYDVPFKSKDDEHQSDNSDEVFTYLICAVCPVKQTQPKLDQRYPKQGTRHRKGRCSSYTQVSRHLKSYCLK